VDCSTFRKSLDEDARLNADAAEHALTCAACSSRLEEEASALVLDLNAARPSARDGESLSAVKDLIERERGVLGLVRSLSGWWRVTIACTALGLAVLLERRAQPLLELSMHGVAFAVASTALLWPLWRRLPRYAQGTSAAAALALPFLFAFWTHHTHAPFQIEKRAVPCLLVGLLMSAPFLALLCALDRRALLSLSRSLLAGASAGVAGNALLHLHCASTGLGHLLASHALLAALAAGLASFVLLLRSRELVRGE
jgi:hypothetical protein